MKKYVKDMTQGKPAGLLLSFMLPMIIGNVFQQFYNMVDSMIVGRYVGATALAAVGATGSLNFFIFAVCNGLSNGVGVVVSQYFGAGNEKQVKKAIGNAIYIMLTSALIMGSLGVILARPLLTLLKTPADIIGNSVVYMQIMCGGVFAVALYNGVAAILRGIGDSKTPLYFLIVSSILNVGLDLLFVRVFHMGVAGAGIATIIAQFLSGIGSLCFALKTNPYFRLQREHMRARADIIRQCVRIGIPLSFQMSLIAISCIVLQSVVNTFGSVVVATYTATNRIEQLVQQPYNSLGMAMSTYTGQNVGAGKLDRVKKGYRTGLVMMGIFSMLMLPLAQFGGEFVMRLFVNEADVIAMGSQAIKITSYFYFFLGLIYVSRGTLNGAGDATFSFINGIVEMIGRICFAKPFTMIPGVGVWGIWGATAFTWFITGIVSVIRYMQGKWKRVMIKSE